ADPRAGLRAGARGHAAAAAPVPGHHDLSQQGPGHTRLLRGRAGPLQAGGHRGAGGLRRRHARARDGGPLSHAHRAPRRHLRLQRRHGGVHRHRGLGRLRHARARHRGEPAHAGARGAGRGLQGPHLRPVLHEGLRPRDGISGRRGHPSVRGACGGGSHRVSGAAEGGRRGAGGAQPLLRGLQHGGRAARRARRRGRGGLAGGRARARALGGGMPRTGARLLVDALVEAGARQLFSLSGNQILSVYDATIGRPLPIVHTRHEAGAVHMADAWGRLTETPGVALVTAGPGHLNAVSALYGALMSESPMVLLSGHAPRGQAGRGAFQEMDQVGAARPVTKAAWRVEDAAQMGVDMARALQIAAGGRPGPVHLSLPGDLLEATVADGPVSAIPAGVVAASAVADATIGQIIGLLAEARRPLIVLGPAMARPARADSVSALTRATGIPALPVESPRGLNDPWLHSAANIFAEADLVLLLGKRLDYGIRFGDPGVFAADRRIIQVDWESSALASDARVALSVVEDPAHVARRLAAAAASRQWKHAAWGDEVRAPRAPFTRCESAPRSSPTSIAAPSWWPTAASSASGCRRAARRARGSSMARPAPSAAPSPWPWAPGPRIRIASSSPRWATAPSAFTPSSWTPPRATACR